MFFILYTTEFACPTGAWDPAPAPAGDPARAPDPAPAPDPARARAPAPEAVGEGRGAAAENRAGETGVGETISSWLRWGITGAEAQLRELVTAVRHGMIGGREAAEVGFVRQAADRARRENPETRENMDAAILAREEEVRSRVELGVARGAAARRRGELNVAREVALRTRECAARLEADLEVLEGAVARANEREHAAEAEVVRASREAVQAAVRVERPARDGEVAERVEARVRIDEGAAEAALDDLSRDSSQEPGAQGPVIG